MNSISKIFEITALCTFMAGCSSADIGTPTQIDAENSYNYMFRNYPNPIRILQVGTPQNCRSVKIGEKAAKSCEVCMVAAVLEQDHIVGVRGVKIFNETDRVNFSRAISYNQPETVPVDGNSVLAITGDYSTLSNVSSVSRNLSGDDLVPLHISMGRSNSGGVAFFMNASQVGVDVLLSILSAPDGVKQIKKLVGSCEAAYSVKFN